ncbi:MAG: 6-bladed beta-propeller [Burkholderiales bacterium]
MLFAATMILSACSSGPQKQDEAAPVIQYPPAPEAARYYFERTLSNSGQVVADPGAGRMRRLLTGESQTGDALGKPFDVTVCRGVVYVSDSVRRRVLAFDYPGRRYFRIGDDEPGALLKPLGVASDAACNVYVVDGTLARVMIYDARGKYLSSVGGVAYFKHISHVAVDPAGTRLYIVDTGTVENRDHRIRVFDAKDGKHLQDIGTRGTEPGKFNLPRDIALGADGNLYVVDGGNFRIQVFKTDGTHVRAFGGMGAQFGQFTRPKGIALDGEGRVYVADAAFGNFQIFTPEGQLLLFVGERANKGAPGKYLLPAGIHVDEDGRVYFVDQYFRKIDVFRPSTLPADRGYLAGNAVVGGSTTGTESRADAAVAPKK